MSETKAMNHPNAPHNQPFNINGKRCQSKTRTRWNAGSPTFWRSKSKEKPAIVISQFGD